jgi:hypothetical protein
MSEREKSYTYARYIRGVCPAAPEKLGFDATSYISKVSLRGTVQ